MSHKFQLIKIKQHLFRYTGEVLFANALQIL
jgi:hypothetical protein